MQTLNSRSSSTDDTVYISNPLWWSFLAWGSPLVRCDCFKWWRGVKNAFMSATEAGLKSGERGDHFRNAFISRFCSSSSCAKALQRNVRLVLKVDLNYVYGTAQPAATIIDEMSPSSTSSKTSWVCKIWIQFYISGRFYWIEIYVSWHEIFFPTFNMFERKY